MKRDMNILMLMGIFLISIESGGCDSSFLERSTREIGRRVMKFDSSNRINRHRMLDKRKFLPANPFTLESDTATRTTDSESGPIYSNMMDTRKISQKERITSKSVVELSPDLRSDIHLKMPTSSDGSSLKANESIRIIRYDITMQRRFLIGRKHQLSEGRRTNRLRENVRLSRLNLRQENRNEERMSNMRFRDTDVRKTVRLAKWGTSDFSTTSVRGFFRQNHFIVPKQVTFKDRVRNIVRQEANGAERFIRKDRYNTRNVRSMMLREISVERNTYSKLQQPRHERHLLVPKRELKIPSEGDEIRAINSRRPWKSTRTNDISHGNMEEEITARKSGRGLQRTQDKRLDSGRRHIIEAVVRHEQNQMTSVEYNKIKNHAQTRRNSHNYGIESSGRIQSRQRKDVLGLNKRNKDASSRAAVDSYQTRKINDLIQTRRNEQNSRIESPERIQNRQIINIQGSRRKDRQVSTRKIPNVFQTLENTNLNIKLKTNELISNRRGDKRFSRRTANVLTNKRIHFTRENKLSNENRKLMMQTNSKENVPYDISIRSRNIQHQDRRKHTLKSGMRTVERELEHKQRYARSNEKFSTEFRFQINNERFISTPHNKLRETRNRNRDLRIRNQSFGREINMENRRSILRLAAPLNERLVKSLADIRTSADNKIASIRRIITSSSGLKEDIQMVRLYDKRLISTGINMRNLNRRAASNQRSEQRTENIRLTRENIGCTQKDVIRYRVIDPRNRRFKSRINEGRILNSHRIRDEFKQSNVRVSSDLTRESLARMTAQTRKELGGQQIGQQQRRISVRSSPKYLVSTPKLHSTARNSTSKDSSRSYSVSKLEERISSKNFIISYRTATLNRPASPKSLSSNKSFMDFYEYISEKRSSIMSLILNVMLGLAVIFVSSDDKNKGFIPRRLTPFVDGFLKYTTVI